MFIWVSEERPSQNGWAHYFNMNFQDPCGGGSCKGLPLKHQRNNNLSCVSLKEERLVMLNCEGFMHSETTSM